MYLVIVRQKYQDISSLVSSLQHFLSFSYFTYACFSKLFVMENFRQRSPFKIISVGSLLILPLRRLCSEKVAKNPTKSKTTTSWTSLPQWYENLWWSTLLFYFPWAHKRKPAKGEDKRVGNFATTRYKICLFKTTNTWFTELREVKRRKLKAL